MKASGAGEREIFRTKNLCPGSIRLGITALDTSSLALRVPFGTSPLIGQMSSLDIVAIFVLIAVLFRSYVLVISRNIISCGPGTVPINQEHIKHPDVVLFC